MYLMPCGWWEKHETMLMKKQFNLYQSTGGKRWSCHRCSNKLGVIMKELYLHGMEFEEFVNFDNDVAVCG